MFKQFTIALTLMVGAQTVSAQTFNIRVERATGGACIGGVEYDADEPANQPFELELSTCANRVKITADSGVSIPRITLTGGGTTAVQISMGTSFLVTNTLPTPVGNDWGGLDASQLEDSQFYGGIGGDLTGSVLVDHLYYFRAEGDIGAGIVAGAAGVGGVCVAECAGNMTSTGGVIVGSGTVTRVLTTGMMAGEITAGGSLSLVESGGDCSAEIESTNGSITNIFIGGDLTGPVKAENGKITTIDVAGAITTADQGGNIPIRAKNGIEQVFAASASAGFTVLPNGGTSKIGLFKMESGHFSGRLYLKSLTPPTMGGESGIVINGDLTGAIRFFAGGTITEPIMIEGSLAGGVAPGLIQYDAANSLTNQVIINTPGYTDGAWGGSVTVNSVELLPKPSYDNLPSTFGGGAVGFSAFTFHPKATSPQDDSEVTPFHSAVVDHYGPVINTETGVPLRVDRRTAGSTNENDFVNVTNLFQQTVESTAPYRHITVTRGGSPGLYESGYEYRMTPVIANQQTGTTRLKCRYGAQPYSLGVSLYDYRFTVVPPFDMNGDNLVNLTDVGLWPSDPRDFNNDQSADVSDFAMLVNAAGNP